MNSKRFIIAILLIGFVAFGLWAPSNPATAKQQIFTPTAMPDGRIIYVVRAGENCYVVAAKNGITVEQLRAYNTKLDENCTIQEGEELLVGLVGLAAGTPTAGPSLTPAPPTITPTPFTGTTEICALLFDDVNGDSLRQEIEPALAGGAVSVTENNGKYSDAKETDINSDPDAYQGICFSDIPEGEYTVSVAVPDGYNPTMSVSSSLKVKAGDRAFVDFGAQSQQMTVTKENPDEGSFSMLGLVGIFFLLAGAGLGFYAWRAGKPESKFSGGGIIRK